MNEIYENTQINLIETKRIHEIQAHKKKLINIKTYQLPKNIGIDYLIDIKNKFTSYFDILWNESISGLEKLDYDLSPLLWIIGHNAYFLKKFISIYIRKRNQFI